MHTHDNYASINTSYEITTINNVTMSTSIHIIAIWFLNKYDYHIAHVCPIAFLLYSIYRPKISPHICKINKNATLIYHIIAVYVPAPKMPLKSHIYATCPNYLLYINEGSRLTYMHHMNSLAQQDKQCCTNKTMMPTASSIAPLNFLGQDN